MMLHGEADDRPVIAVQHGGQIQLAVRALNLRNIAQVFDARLRGGEISLHQIAALLVTAIALCQAVWMPPALQKPVLPAETIALPVACTERWLYCFTQSPHAVTRVFLPCFFQGRYQLRIAVCPHGPAFPLIIPFPAHAKRLTAQGYTDPAMIPFDPCIQLPWAYPGYRPAIKPSAFRRI